VYTGSEALAEGSIVSDLVETQVALDTALDEQESLMEELIVPAGIVLQGWNLWKRVGCGSAVSNKVALEKSGEISEELYNSAWYEYAPLLEPLWQVVYRISQQPAEENNYTVKGQILSEDSWTDTDDAAYQWYLYGEKNLSCPVTNTADADEIEATNCWEGMYDEDAECWTGSVEYSSAAVIDVIFPVEKGDVITVELSDNFAGTVEEFNGEEYEAEDGVYTMEITESGYHNIYISDGTVDRFTAVITVSRTLPDHTRMDGQDSASLDTSDLESGTYFCEVTFDPDGDKCVIDSETAEYTKPAAPVGKTGVYIGGIELAAVGYYIYDTETDTLNTGSEEDHNAYLTWDEENGYVLTIKDLTVEQDSSAALLSESDLTLVLQGTNTLIGKDAAKDLTTHRRGVPDAADGASAGSSAGVAVLDGDLTIRGRGILYAEGGAVQDGDSFGLDVNGKLLIEGAARVFLRGGESGGGSSFGAGVVGRISVEDTAYLKAVGGSADKMSLGMGTQDSVFFDGGVEIHAEGDDRAVGVSDNDVSIGEGEYTLYANEEIVESVDDWSEVWLFVMEQGKQSDTDDGDDGDDDDDDAADRDDDKPKHRCTSECGICGGCLDEDCREKVCRTKCVLFDMDFEDVQDGKWYSEAVEYVYHRGLMTGDGSGLFDIGGTTTRAMVVSILWRLEGEPEAIYALDYDDVAEGKWYTEAVRWAAAENVASGYGNGRFGVNDPITREQLASMLYRYEQYKGGGFVGAWMFGLQHPDAAEVSAWAYEPMCWMTMNGILNGDEAGMLNPRDTASRAELAQILMGYLEK
ncbi:MAG: S-layer homology domain-containing protein, partial [Butyricicoccus sp.]|nr:S-layer homology domain-containing protein [Butyricicoccus sp.]